MKIKLQKGAIAPTSATPGSCGFDLYALEPIIIEAQGRRKVKTGVHLEIPRGQVGILCHRSGLNSIYGLQAYGTIDSDYRGEVLVTLFNQERFRDYKIQRGDRIAQIVFVDINKPTLEVVDELTDTDRGEGGHGSTGV